MVPTAYDVAVPISTNHLGSEFTSTCAVSVSAPRYSRIMGAADEADTNTAYERAVEHPKAASSLRETLEQGSKDEQRHCDWILKQLGRD
ncbi:MAG: hypothetical protein JWL84_4977 [Rhodospirillales bacterium]|jgi:hypothetical protein|nr:hypothetical protein [Rhodospirillales bacterium]